MGRPIKAHRIWRPVNRSNRETTFKPSDFEASPHKRRLKCDTKHQSQEADATFITSDGSNRTNLGGHSIQMMIITNQATT